jgi:hypothetical protein
MERIRETLREDGRQTDGGQNLEILERLQRLEDGMGEIQRQLLELSGLGVVNTDPYSGLSAQGPR